MTQRPFSLAETGLTMFLNFSVSVLIIWVNKYAYNLGFRFNISLTVFHFAVTYIGLLISARCFGFFKPVHVPVRKVLPISLAFCGFVVFNNLSLQYNAVGVYQLLKVLTTPVIVLLQLVLHGTWLPRSQSLALIPTCIGVILATVSHLEANWWGSIFGILGIFSTSLYQILVKTEQESLKLTPPQLLFNQSKLSVLILSLVAPLCEDVLPSPYAGYLQTGKAAVKKAFLGRVGQPVGAAVQAGVARCMAIIGPAVGWSDRSYSRESWFPSPSADAGKSPSRKLPKDGVLDFEWYTPELLAVVFLSAALAFLVNLSIFLVIAKTNAVSYNVLGHAKLVCVLVSGYCIFGEVATSTNLAGVCLAVIGIISYTHLVIQARQHAVAVAASKTDGGGLMKKQK